MIDISIEKFEGIIAHFNATGFVVSVGKHGLEVVSKVFYARLFRIKSDKTFIIINKPPIKTATDVNISTSKCK